MAAGTPALIALGLWLGLELVGGPPAMEFARQAPFRWRQLPPPRLTRLEVFYVLWVLQVLFTLMIVIACAFAG